ncbi:MAG: reverse transcriptase N-terminal domain-containing protein [Desulfosporosinus sp.]
MRKTSNCRKSTLPPDTQWKQIDWFLINGHVEKLQQRIYRAECLGDKYHKDRRINESLSCMS